MLATEDSVANVVTLLPPEISLYVLRHLGCLDLLTACAASATWWRLASAERLWQRACEHRWPDAFADRVSGQLPEAAIHSAPFAMPPWVERTPSRAHHIHVPARRDPRLASTPSAHSPAIAWRAYYIEHDIYEALNVAPAFLDQPQMDALCEELQSALQKVRTFACVPMAAAAECPEAVSVLASTRGLHHLTVALPPPARDEEERSAQTASALALLQAVTTPSGEVPAQWAGAPGGPRGGGVRSLWLNDAHLGRSAHSMGEPREYVPRLLQILGVAGLRLEELDLSHTPLRPEVPGVDRTHPPWAPI